MSLVLISSEAFADHVTPPGHPERVERAEAMDVVALEWRRNGGTVIEPRPATREELARIHDPTYLDAIAKSAGRAVALDPDTFTSPRSHDVALLAAGAACQGVEHALTVKVPVVAMVRPPGHHAERARAMGFCLYNNIAVGAAHALTLGLQRVAIVDFDVHHGNGTQWMFYDDPQVLFISLHQYPFYPGTGAASDVGEGAGRGFTVNVPLDAGATDTDYELLFQLAVEPVLDAFDPELLMVSAGFDAHRDDPLASMRVSDAGFASMVNRLWTFARRTCSDRLVAITEGGYHLRALKTGLDTTVKILAGQLTPSPIEPGDTSRAMAALAAVRASQRSYWPATFA